MDADDEFLDKAIEGAVMFALNQGEVCTCPSRMLVHESIFDAFMERVIARTQDIKVGNPMDPDTMMGAQVSSEQFDRILGYIDIAKTEGGQVLCGGTAHSINSGLEKGYYIKPTIVYGKNNMRVFQEEIFGPVLTVFVYPANEYEKYLELADKTSQYALTGALFAQDRQAVVTGQYKLRYAPDMNDIHNWCDPC